MHIKLIRKNAKKWGIDGELNINGEKFCDTVEHPLCRLPQGEYTIHFRSHPFRHGDGPMLAVNGEIIVGTYALPGMVTNSRPVYERLYDLLKKAARRVKTVKLTVC